MPAAAPHWPGWAYDTRTADYWTERLSEELGEVLTLARAEQIARDYAANNPGPRDGRTDAELTMLALAWLATQGLDFAPAIAAAINGIRVDGALIGVASAHAVLAGRATADLGGWKPGRTAAALDLLDTYGVDEPAPVMPDAPNAVDAAQSRIKHVARALALGTLAGGSARDLSGKLRDALAFGLGAIALTELVQAAAGVAMRLFGRAKVELVRWSVDPRLNNCPKCVGNENEGPIPLGQPFQSGDQHPPLHPRCACAVLPA